MVKIHFRAKFLNIQYITNICKLFFKIFYAHPRGWYPVCLSADVCFKNSKLWVIAPGSEANDFPTKWDVKTPWLVQDTVNYFIIKHIELFYCK